MTRPPFPPLPPLEPSEPPRRPRRPDVDPPTRFLAHLGDLGDPVDPDHELDPTADAAVRAAHAARRRAALNAVDDPANDAPRIRADGLVTLLVLVGLIVLLAVVVLCVLPVP